MFPTREMRDGFGRLLERDQVHQLLLEAYPELADHIEVDETNPLLKIQTRRGGAVILWKGEVEGTTQWRLASPEGEGVKVSAPSSIEEFPRLVGESLGLDG